MKYLLCFTTFLLLTNFASGQKDTVYQQYEDIDELKKQIIENEIVELRYVDSTFQYACKVPSWLNLLESGNDAVWGGTFPAVDGVENALIIIGSSKDKFESFDQFKEIHLTGNTFGQPVKWGADQTWLGQNELTEIEHGAKRKVYIFWNGLIYHNQFVLLETKTAYLWIKFTASPETYDKNIGKFEEFMKGLELLK